MAGHFGTKQNRTPACKLCAQPKYRAGLCREHYFARERTRRAEARKPVSLTCSQCSKEFKAIPIARRKYCSYACVNEARRIRERTTKKPPSSATCKICGTVFAPKKPWHVFCSEPCSYRAKSARIYTKGRRVEKRITGNCESCGKPFSQPRRMYVKRFSARNPKFCSLDCAYKARRDDKSPKFRGGIITYRGCRWLQIADEIRARDEFLCGICHALQKLRRKHPVDHTIPFRLMEMWGLDPNHYDNLLTMCDSCHGKKQSVEDKLLRGDVLGFIRGLVTMNYPIERIRAACAVAELSTKGIPNVA
jgi:5-methylcytosine-specific restriction endonuclease McrA